MRPSQRPAARRSPEACLLAAVASDAPETRLAHAREGLAALALGAPNPELQLLLTRQRYVAHLAQRRFRRALLDAEAMIDVGVLRDVAYHDASRALVALGELERAVAMQRLAARTAHPERRSFHGFCLATLLHFTGRPEDALAAIKRALRSSSRDRLLLIGQAVYVRLDAGLPVRRAAEVATKLRASAHGKGYGRFLTGMIAMHLGDTARAVRDLEAFLARHEGADVARAITLREEIRRTRLALGRLRAS